MWTCHALCVFTVVFLATVTGGGGRVCQPMDFLLIQDRCRHQNEALLSAEEDHNDTMVCTSLYDLWYCVAKYVPVCFINLTDIYGIYLHSPHNCYLSPQQLLTLQNLTMHGLAKGVDVSTTSTTNATTTTTTTAIPDSTSTFPSSTSSSSLVVEVVTVTDGDEGGGGGGGEGGGGGKEETRKGGGHGKGDQHKHTGSGSSPTAQYTLGKAVVSWIVSWPLLLCLLRQ